MNKKLTALILFICFLLWFPRILSFGSIPTGTYWDETAMLVDAKAFVATGLDHHGLSFFKAIIPSYGDYKLPVYLWLVNIFSKLIGPSQISLRLPGLIAGILTIVVGYMISRKLFQSQKSDQKDQQIIGYITLFLLTISPVVFFFSRVGFESFLAQLFLAVGVLITITKLPLLPKSILAALMGTIAAFTYYSAIYIFPPLYILSLGLFGFDLPETKKRIFSVGSKLILILGIIGATTFLTLNIFSHDSNYAAFNNYRLSTNSILNQTDYAIASNQFRLLAGNHFWDRILYHRQVLLGHALLSNVLLHLSPTTIFWAADSNLRHSLPNTGMFLWPLLPFLFIGLLALLKSQPKVLILLVVWSVLAVVPASVPTQVPHLLRALPVIMPLTLTISFGLFVTYKFICNWKTSNALIVLYLGLLLIVFFSYLYQYFVIYPKQSYTAWQTDYRQLATIINQYTKADEKVLILHPDNKVYLWFLAYTPVEGNQMAQFKYQNWLLNTWQNIDLGQNPQFYLSNKYQVVAGEKDLVNQYLLLAKTQSADCQNFSQDAEYNFKLCRL